MIKLHFPQDMAFEREDNILANTSQFDIFINQYGNKPFLAKRVNTGAISVVHACEVDKSVRAFYLIDTPSYTSCEIDTWPSWSLVKCTNWTIKSEFFNDYIFTNYNKETYCTLGIPKLNTDNPNNKTMSFRNSKIIMNELNAYATFNHNNLVNYTLEIRKKYYLTRKYASIFDTYFDADLTKHPKNTLKNRIIWSFRCAAANAVSQNIFNPDIDLKGLDFPDGYFDSTDMTQIFERIQ